MDNAKNIQQDIDLAFKEFEAQNPEAAKALQLVGMTYDAYLASLSQLSHIPSSSGSSSSI